MSEARLAIAGISAADFYRRRFPAFMAPEPSGFTFEGPCVYKDEDAWSAAPFWIDSSFVAAENGALHVLTRSAAERGSSRNVRAHVWSGELPPGAFFEYSQDVVIATPGFVFLQLATELDFAQLVAYGNELCGLYALDASEPAGYRRRDVPLMTVGKLAAFIEGAAGMRGYRQAKNALPSIVEGSPTPTCAMAEMLLCLSVHRGGYALPVPDMGRHVHLTERSSLIAGADELVVGGCWDDAAVCFDAADPGSAGDSWSDLAVRAASLSLEAAEGARQPAGGVARSFDEARSRAVALEFSGYGSAAIDAPGIASIQSFESFAQDIAAKLGKAIPKKKCGPLPQREALRSSLFTWLDAHGHAR